jgi:hypothetical protein
VNFDFHIVVHGILVVVLNQPEKKGASGYMEIVIPYDSCHDFIAASMNFDGSVIWQCDLSNRRHGVTGVTAPACPRYTHPDSNLLFCELVPGQYGSNTWCTIGRFPIPKIVPLRRFGPKILKASGYTYTHNQLNVVDRVGVPSAYALMFGEQESAILLDLGTDVKRIMPGKDNVARLHIYAEPPTNMEHDALKTLSYCIAGFDLGASSTAGQAMPGPVPSGIEAWEQDTLYEHQQIRISHVPPCFLDMSMKLEDNSPRTCIPVVGGG